jgi:predicted DNA-binding ribbon-helix-helix protein
MGSNSRASETSPTRSPGIRVQTGVRLEKRLVKVLKALAEFYDLSLGDLLEDLVLSTFAGRNLFSDAALALVTELARIYGLDSGSYRPAVLGAPARES